MKIKDPNYQGFFSETLTRLFEDIGNQPSHSDAEFFKYPKEINPILSTIYPSYTLEECLVDNNLKYDINPSKKALVGFSCGKDSVATIIKLKEQGYDVIAFAVYGINRQYPQELDTAQALCDALDVPLVTYRISCTGKSEYFENPIKNLLILSYMIDYGIREGITTYSLGNHAEDNLKESNVLFNWSDSKEILSLFAQFVQNYFPNYLYLNGLERDENPYQIIYNSEYNMLDIMDIIYSCITTNRFRNSLRVKNLDKYNIKNPLHGRCFTCYKCAYEYITLVHLQLIEVDIQYYKRCHQILYSKLEQVFNINPKKVKVDKDRMYSLYGIPSTKEALNWINKKNLI